MDTREWVQQYKKNLKCEECGESDPICLVFHHPIRDLKVASIHKLVERKASIEEIKKEIEKCIVLCFNCHLKHHRDLREQSKLNQFFEEYVFE
jgi:transcription elongation factor Elf1